MATVNIHEDKWQIYTCNVNFIVHCNLKFLIFNIFVVAFCGLLRWLIEGLATFVPNVSACCLMVLKRWLMVHLICALPCILHEA